MHELNLILYGDPVLKLRADRIEDINEEIRRVAQRMVEVMDEYAGIGLAAPQVGISRRLIVVRVEEDRGPVALVNPEITSRSGLQEKDEGCLSLPGVSVPLKRAQKIRVAGTGLDGRPFEMEAEELASRTFQHEVDHIDGILIIDRIGKERMKAIADHLAAIKRGEVPAQPE